MGRDEMTSGIIHLIGTALAISATVVLVIFAVAEGNAWYIVSFSLFGAALILLYASSSAYHLATSPSWRPRLRRLDHSMVFILIAGTYTPLALTALRGGWGWSLFGVAWGIAAVGVLWKLIGSRIDGWLSMTLYLFLGWLVAVAFVPLSRALPIDAIFWLVSGGIFYTAGAVFLLFSRFPFFRHIFSPHNVFHLCVILGSTSHFVMTLKLLPQMAR